MEVSESFFDALKAQRKSQNIEISEICEFTKINPKYIEAIEMGDFNVLPNVYIRLFLRAYANFIGADTAKVLNDYEFYTTGKVRKKETKIKEETHPLASSSNDNTNLDGSFQITTRQIIKGGLVIVGILVLLWWVSMLTQEQTENNELIQSKEKMEETPVQDNEEKTPALPPASDQSPPNSQSITTKKIVIVAEKQPASSLKISPLNNNDFLSEKFDTSNTISNFVLSTPYALSVHALESTKIHLSEKRGNVTTELINDVIPANWRQSFLFESTIQFEFWNPNQISVKLNEKSIDHYLQSNNMAIRGSYEGEKSQLYLSFYQH